MKGYGKTLLTGALLGSVALAPQVALADGSIKVGLLATLEGPPPHQTQRAVWL